MELKQPHTEATVKAMELLIVPYGIETKKGFEVSPV